MDNIFAERIKILCKERNLTRRELAQKAGFSSNVLSLSGGSAPSLKNLYKICDVLEISIADFLQGNYVENITPVEMEFLDCYSKILRREQWLIKEFIKTLCINHSK